MKERALISSLLSTFGSLATGYPLPVAMPAVEAVHKIRYVNDNFRGTPAVCLLISAEGQPVASPGAIS